MKDKHLPVGWRKQETNFYIKGLMRVYQYYSSEHGLVWELVIMKFDGPAIRKQFKSPTDAIIAGELLGA